MKTLRQVLLVPFVLSWLLVGCSTPGSAPPTTVTKVVIETTAVLLENVGATQQLVARALDAKGKEVAAEIRWESSRPDTVRVSAGGLASGLAVGSSQLRAVADGVASAPLIAAVGILADDVVRIPSDKVVAGPDFGNGCGSFEVGCHYTVVLKDVSPTPGRLWFSKSADGTPVQGAVVSSRTVAAGTEVTLEVVALQDIFKDLRVDEVVELPSDELIVSEELRAAYDVTPLADGSYLFTPRSGAGALDTLDFENGLVRCTGSLPPTSVSLGLPSFVLNLGNPRFEFGFQVPIPFVTAGFVRFLFTANPSVTINSGTHTIIADFNNQGLRCTFKNGISQPFQALGFGFTAKLVPGITIGGSYGAGQRSFSAQVAASSNVRLGFDCRPPAACVSLTQAPTGLVRGTVTLSNLGNLAGTIRDLEAGAFANVSISADAPVLGSLTLFNFVEGYDMAFDLASLRRQIQEDNPADYRLGQYLEIDPFAAIKSLVAFILGSGAANSLGLDPIDINVASIQSPLVTSATVTSQTIRGVTVSVQLDPKRINFFGTVSPFGLLYNVAKIQLIGMRSDGSTAVIAETTPASGATSATLSAPLFVWNGFTSRHVTVIPVVLSELPVGTRTIP